MLAFASAICFLIYPIRPKSHSYYLCCHKSSSWYPSGTNYSQWNLLYHIHCIISLEWHTVQNILECKLVNSKRSYSKHTLLSTATNLQLICFGTILPRAYIRPTLSDYFFFYLTFILLFLSFFHLFLFYSHYHSFIVFSFLHFWLL